MTTTTTTLPERIALLIQTLDGVTRDAEGIAEKQDIGNNSPDTQSYYEGKAAAYRLAAKWLREELAK